MNSNENDIQQLLEKYLNGTLSDAERARVEEWYSSFDLTRSEDTVFDNAAQEQKEYRFILDSIHSKLHNDPELTGKWSYRGNVIKIAALVTAFVMTALSYYYLKVRSVAEPELAINTVVVKPGEMKTITLADGTKIWLNAATRFSYPRHFSSGSREVTLTEGEAFFEVTHNDHKPFIVHSKGINTQVLGTSFNISAYQYTKSVVVSVATGKVGVSTGKKLIGFLTPDEKINYGLVTNKYVKTVARSAVSTSWMKGEIVLDEVGFEELKAIIYDNYQYALTGDKKFNRLSFSATLKKTDNIISVMELLSSINHTTYSLTNKTIVMH